MNNFTAAVSAILPKDPDVSKPEVVHAEALNGSNSESSVTTK